MMEEIGKQIIIYEIGEQIIVFLAVNKNGDEIILDQHPRSARRDMDG